MSDLVAIARRHVGTAAGAVASDPEGALALAYDSSRKAATALLAHQGLRPTTAGGHLAVVHAMSAQFPDVPGLKSLDRLRRRRNDAEYPDPHRYHPVTQEEAQDAIVIGEDTINSVVQLLDVPQLGVFR